MRKRKFVCGMHYMKKGKVFAAAFLLLLLAFVPALSTFAYEDNYGQNGDIPWRFAEDYYNGIYTLSNSMNSTTSTLTLFLVTQDAYYVDEWSIVYEFPGKMDLEEEHATYGFEINMGMPLNYTATSTVQMGGVDANIRQMQVGIYPGYYNFYNYGYNCVNRANASRMYARTLGPNYKLFEDDAYGYYDTVPDDSFVEVQEGENKRLYVIIGESEFLKVAQEDFEAWAIETEAHYIEEAALIGDNEEIEAEVPEENLEDLLESAASEVEVEVQEPGLPVETPLPETPVFVEESKSPNPVGIVAIAALVVACIAILIALIKSKVSSRV